jgi:hypothetical protein
MWRRRTSVLMIITLYRNWGYIYVKEGTSVLIIITLYRNWGYMYVKEENLSVNDNYII